MLSILIPEYNCDCTRLVHDLSYQCLQEQIEFEILVLDDASPAFPAENEVLPTIAGCKLFKNEVNLGLAATRNRLARLAKYPWLLILDSDLQVMDHRFVRHYLDVLGRADVIVGGLSNAEEKPSKDRMLRWKYSRIRECRSAEERNKTPWQSFFSSNILMKKTLQERFPFEEGIRDYGHEDTLLGHRMKQRGCTILNIDNPLLHLGIDLSERFLEKSLIAVEKCLNADVFNSEELIGEVRLFRYFRFLQRFGMVSLIAWKFNILKKLMRANLLGSHPLLVVFDCYRLGHLCAVFIQKKKSGEIPLC